MIRPVWMSFIFIWTRLRRSLFQRFQKMMLQMRPWLSTRVPLRSSIALSWPIGLRARDEVGSGGALEAPWFGASRVLVLRPERHPKE